MKKFIDISKSNCDWSYDKYDEFWETSCGGAYFFEVGGLIENETNFCSKCGGRIVEIKDEDEDEDEDE